MKHRPRNTKYKKQQKGKQCNKIGKPLSLFSLKKSITLKAVRFGKIKENHIITCRKIIHKILQKSGQLVIKISADTPISKKPTEIRMGKGKGPLHHWAAKISPGTVLFEVEGGSSLVAIKSLRQAQLKLPLKTKISKN
jgi:large subunit ribosomal protein L16